MGQENKSLLGHRRKIRPNIVISLVIFNGKHLVQKHYGFLSICQLHHICLIIIPALVQHIPVFVLPPYHMQGPVRKLQSLQQAVVLFLPLFTRPYVSGSFFVFDRIQLQHLVPCLDDIGGCLPFFQGNAYTALRISAHWSLLLLFLLCL